VKRRNIILSLSSAILGFVFLAGSTGVTLIIHNCPVCGKFSAKSGIFVSPSEPEDHCCQAADKHCASEGSTSVESSCCHFIIKKFKLANYSPEVPLLLSAPAELPETADLFDNYNIHESITLPHDLHNKHGGRLLITYNCQLLA
jgi:hypothetical protein